MTAQSDEHPRRRASGAGFGPYTEWTDELIAELTQLWNTIGITGRPRWSGSEIAEKLGVTREAVIGKAWRLSLPARQTNVANSARMNGPQVLRRAPRPVREGRPPKQYCERVPAVASPPLATGAGCSLLELSNESCRWPHGDPVHGGFRFCGKPEADLAGGHPYCRFHRRMAYAGGGR
jgi:GcrA cell cycle regulator